MNALDYFTDEDKALIGKAIKQAEIATSGEVRVYIEDRCKTNVMDRAAFVFEEMKIHKTAQRNGVLFYLALQDQKFAVIGDAGIHAIVGQDFWDSVKEIMVAHFKHGRFTAGLTDGILEAGKVLQKHFPYKSDDSNELSNEIVIE